MDNEILKTHLIYLSLKEKNVLDLLINNPLISQKEISIKLETTESYISKIVRKLAKNGIITKDYITKRWELK